MSTPREIIAAKLAVHQVSCPKCNGSGSVGSKPYTHPTNPNLDGWTKGKPCGKCDGTGKVDHE